MYEPILPVPCFQALHQGLSHVSIVLLLRNNVAMQLCCNQFCEFSNTCDSCCRMHSDWLIQEMMQPLKQCHANCGLDLQELILAVPPFQAAHQGPSLAIADFQELRTFVDYFSVMTYDASHPGRPGPNAPWSWVKSNIEAVVPVPNDR